jgi:transcriptional regulator with XRE-family HTH domain
MKYYQRLRDLREDHDLLQEDIAEKLGTTRQQYNRYETGQRELPMHHFITLANFYNVSLDYLAGLIDHPKMLKSKKVNEVKRNKGKINNQQNIYGGTNIINNN